MTNQPKDTKDMSELLPCPLPWCNFREPFLYSCTSGEEHQVCCGLDDCNCETPLYRTKAEAIAAWNTRSSPPVPSDSVVERERLAADIARVAGCQIGSERTKRLVDFIITRAALSTIDTGRVREEDQ